MATTMTRTVPHKLSELGRIRLGDREPNKSGRGVHPRKLADFRLTSPNRSLLGFAAAAYGGEVEPWDDEWAPRDEHGRPTQYELYTTTNALDVLIPTLSALSLSFEQWSLSGCQRRCTGAVITHCPLQEALVGTPCTCPEDDLARVDLAKDGKACFRILRLNVLLPDLPGIGAWRLETKGFYATAELLGTLDMLQMAGHDHTIIEAVLRLEQRTMKRPGKGEGKGTLQFAVPVLWPKATPRQLLAHASQVLLTPPVPPLPLARTIADVYGDATDLHTTAAAYVPRIEAVIVAQPGWNVADWDTWAERRFHKTKAAFTEAEWQLYLDRVERAASEKRDSTAQDAPGTTILPQEGMEEGGSALTAPAGAETPETGQHIWTQADPDLFAREEAEASEYGGA